MISRQQSDLFRIWNALRGRRSMPRVSDLTASSIGTHLQDLLIIEQQASGEGQVRLAGSAVCALLGREVSGKGFASLWQDRDHADLSRLMAAIFDETSAAAIGAIGHREHYAPQALSCLLLPVEADENRPRRIVGTLTLTGDQAQSLFPVQALQIASIRILDREPVRQGIHAAGIAGNSVALRKGHLVLLKSKSAVESGSSVIRR
jgi:hypothetical protein